MTEAEIAVVGAGPGGMRAAVSAASSGKHVVLLDNGALPGGQFYRQPSHASLSRDPQAQALIDAVLTHKRIEYRPNTTVWHANASGAGLQIRYEDASSAGAINANALILATGAYERVLPFRGWTLPGVMTAGSAQTVLKQFGVIAGKRIIVAGSGPFLLPVAVQLVRAGAHVAAVCEAAPFTRVATGMAVALLRNAERRRVAQGYLQTLRDAGVRMIYGSAVVAAHGSERVEHVEIARLCADWTPAKQRETLEADALAVSFGFLPSSDLARELGCVMDGAFVHHDTEMRTSVGGVYAVGEITAIRGAEAAMVQGDIAGFAAAGTRAPHSAYRRFRKDVRFARAISRTFALRDGWRSWTDASTVTCRCERVTIGIIDEAIARVEVTDAKAVKALTRCGMGPCQGRICAYAVEQLTGSASGALQRRGIVSPVRLASLYATSD